MAEAPQTRVWIGRMTFMAICLVLIFCRLLPLETLAAPDLPLGFDPKVDRLPPLPAQWAMPDALVVIAAAWAVRRPDYLPVIVVAGLFLLVDFLFQRPPGLWAALMVGFTEFLRARSNAMRALPFAVEWMTVSLGIVAITLLSAALLALVDRPQAALSLVITQMALTCLIYPPVVAIAHFVFGVSRPAPGEVDALGHRL